VPTRGDQTREHLLDVAEQLFGHLGLDNVSLRQIRLAAGQGNTAAVQYHFGDRDGVVAAIVQRHAPKVLAIQAELAARLDERSADRFRALVEVLVRPLADYIALGPSERAWAKLLAELLSDPQLSIETIAAHSADETVDVGRAIATEMRRTMPVEIAGGRIWAVSQFAIQMCASRAKIQDDPKSSRPLIGHDDFVRDLVDMAAGALAAPVSAPAADAPTSRP
jgi:AcrR family transcriptional regulator